MGYRPKAKLAIDRDGDPPVYKVDEIMKIGIKTEQDCYIYLLEARQGRTITILYPQGDESNFASANVPFFIPQQKGKGLKITEPAGLMVIWAVGTPKKFNVDKYHPDDLIQRLLAQGVMAKLRVMIKD
jgi:hypothetical protein